MGWFENRAAKGSPGERLGRVELLPGCGGIDPLVGDAPGRNDSSRVGAPTHLASRRPVARERFAPFHGDGRGTRIAPPPQAVAMTTSHARRSTHGTCHVPHRDGRTPRARFCERLRAVRPNTPPPAGVRNFRNAGGCSDEFPLGRLRVRPTWKNDPRQESARRFERPLRPCRRGCRPCPRDVARTPQPGTPPRGCRARPRARTQGGPGPEGPRA